MLRKIHFKKRIDRKFIDKKLFVKYKYYILDWNLGIYYLGELHKIKGDMLTFFGSKIWKNYKGELQKKFLFNFSENAKTIKIFAGPFITSKDAEYFFNNNETIDYQWAV